MSELKPCPFCGGTVEAVNVENNPPETIFIQCDGCGVGFHQKWMQPEVLVKRFNTRPNECDREELLKVADEIDEDCGDCRYFAGADGCNKYGEVGHEKRYADRIRKALVVE